MFRRLTSRRLLYIFLWFALPFIVGAASLGGPTLERLDIGMYHVFTKNTAGGYNSASIQFAVNRADSANKTIFLQPNPSGNWTIDADVTVPSNRRLMIPAGAILSINGSRTLTLLAPYRCENTPCFTGSGTVVGFDAQGQRNVQHFGNDIAAALRGTAVTAGPVFFPPGAYTLSVSTTFPVTTQLRVSAGATINKNGFNLTLGSCPRLDQSPPWHTGSGKLIVTNCPYLKMREWATSGAGTSASRWDGWQEAHTWPDDTTYDFGNEFYTHATTITGPFRSVLRGDNADIRYSGSAHSIDFNAAASGDTMIQGRTRITGLQWRPTTSATTAIYVKNVYEMDFDHNVLEGWSTAALLFGGTNVGGACSFVINITENKLMNNPGDGIKLIECNNHNQYRIAGNRIQGNQGWALNFSQAMKAVAVVGNDLEGNSLGLMRTISIFGMEFSGNYWETADAVLDAIVFTGGFTYTQYGGINIHGNIFAVSSVTPTGRAIGLYAHTGGVNPEIPPFEGIQITGNSFVNYGCGTHGAILLATSISGPERGNNYSNFSGNSVLNGGTLLGTGCRVFEGLINPFYAQGNVLEEHSAYVTLNFPSVAANGGVQDLDVAIPYNLDNFAGGCWEAKLTATYTINLVGQINFPLEAGLIPDAFPILAAVNPSKIRARLTNTTAAPIDPANRDWLIVVRRIC